MPRLPRSRFFPPADEADPDGLLQVGGRLTTQRLLDAYRHGIFPWPFVADPDRVAWWSPDPRAVLELDQFHVPRRLARTIRGGRFETSVDRDFSAVIAACATVGPRARATWITPALARAYVELHARGFAHSVETWRGGRLVGGVYGVALGGLFAGESMFHLERDASKVALVALVQRLVRQGYRLFDIQQLTSHMEQFGAREIPRREYLNRLATALEASAEFGA